MLSTQMFERFIQESITNPNKPEIKYFNESIIAKKNRSRTRAALGKKQSTPFLSDESQAVSMNELSTLNEKILLFSLKIIYIVAINCYIKFS